MSIVLLTLRKPETNLSRTKYEYIHFKVKEVFPFLQILLFVMLENLSNVILRKQFKIFDNLSISNLLKWCAFCQ